METNPSLFSLTIDPLTKAHLAETARWGRFLSIVGMVFLVLIILIFGVGISFVPDAPFNDISGFSSSGMRIGLALYGIILSAVWFFPLLYLLRFSNRMRGALNGNDQNLLNSSLQNLKILFRYVGIITIIVLALYLLVIIFFLITLGLAR